jgi:hypothetical protein
VAPYRPFDGPGGGDIYLIFVNVRSRKSLLEFVQRFGPLTNEWVTQFRIF